MNIDELSALIQDVYPYVCQKIDNQTQMLDGWKKIKVSLDNILICCEDDDFSPARVNDMDYSGELRYMFPENPDRLEPEILTLFQINFEIRNRLPVPNLPR
jgi:hypothetical protein